MLVTAPVRASERGSARYDVRNVRTLAQIDERPVGVGRDDRRPRSRSVARLQRIVERLLASGSKHFADEWIFSAITFFISAELLEVVRVNGLSTSKSVEAVFDGRTEAYFCVRP